MVNFSEEYENVRRQSAEAFQAYKRILSKKNNRNANLFYIGVMFMTTIYVVHQVLQHLYYRQCSQNLFSVLFMRESVYCKFISYGIYFIESRCRSLLRDVFSKGVNYI